MLDHLVLLLRGWSLSGESLQLFLESLQVCIIFLLLLVHGFF
jgi:hypothetical protein